MVLIVAAAKLAGEGSFFFGLHCAYSLPRSLEKSTPQSVFFYFFLRVRSKPYAKTPPIFHFFKKFVLTQRAGGGQLQSPNTKLNLYNIPTNTNKYSPILLQKIQKAILFILVNQKIDPRVKPILGFTKKMAGGLL
jgi:hypothetical protein